MCSRRSELRLSEHVPLGSDEQCPRRCGKAEDDMHDDAAWHACMGKVRVAQVWPVDSYRSKTHGTSYGQRGWRCTRVQVVMLNGAAKSGTIVMFEVEKALVSLMMPVSMSGCKLVHVRCPNWNNFWQVDSTILGQDCLAGS